MTALVMLHHMTHPANPGGRSARTTGASPSGKHLLFGLLLLLPAESHAVPPGPADPDWPCQQIKVPEVSLPAFWSGPDVDPEHSDWKSDPAVVDLVQRLVPRREPIDHAQSLIRAFARDRGDQHEAKLLQVLIGLFSTLSEERASVIAGLDRFGRRQKELAAQLRTDNERLRALQANPAADADELNKAVQQVTWQAEVFQDRRQEIGYACQVPAKIEQRLFELARTIQDTLQ